MRDHSDALCQLEPSDAHDAMSRGSFPLDPRHFASVWDVVLQEDYGRSRVNR